MLLSLSAFLPFLQASFSLEVFTFFCLEDCYGYMCCGHKLSLIVLAFAIAGLSYDVDDQSLRDAFARFGVVYEGEFSLIYCYMLYGLISVIYLCFSLSC